jgi:thiamine-phosphate pyrophosphorylase
MHRCSGIVSRSTHGTVPVLRRTTPLHCVLHRARDTATMSAQSPSAASRRRKDAARQRFYLVTPAVADPASLLPALDQALAAADIAVVLLRLEKSDERTLINRIKTIAPAVQRREVALLLDSHAELAARSGSDGAHLTGTISFTSALPLLKPDRIAGAGGLFSRHDAMLAGESGADYVMFGEPPPSSPQGDGKGRGRRMPFEQTLEHLVWWAELLEVPCVGYAAGPDEVGPLARTGADFVALGDWIWTVPGGAAQAIAVAAEHLAEPVPR